ncbi:MAG: hypothetical protein A4E48_00268 [Methanosaeta sp. PtaU1.Bin060]|nr:MAG: hypothetical protein A4E48_00268 [Methanosaeta sp. PtaU1.Bin060]
MARGKYNGRSAMVYTPTTEEMAEWTREAKASGCSVSSYILEQVRKARSQVTDSPRPDLSKELEELKARNRELVRDNLQAARLLEQYETELYKLRHAAFAQIDDEKAMTYDPKLLEILRKGKTINSYELLRLLGIDASDSQAVRLVSNQLEELRRFDLVRETPAGWRWVSAPGGK